jgi:hypothetical protein
VSAHFNRISGNTLGVVNLGAGITNAENNWWGCNDGPASAPCDTRGQAVDGDPWLVMTPSADPAAITVGQTSSILADFRVNSDGQITSPSGNIPDGAMVEFGTDLGNFDGDPIMQAPTSAGIAGVTLTADEGPGTAHVTVGLDAAGLSVDVLITGDGTQSPTPTPTTGATPTPTPTGTATATPTPTPTPTGTGAAELTQGDVDCNGDVSSVDALKELRHVAQLSVSQNEPCPNIGEDVASVWGDVDCSGEVTSVDALKVLRYVAQLGYSQTEPCPDIGMPEN